MINVVIDFSGSMRPNGKYAICRNTCVSLSMSLACRFYKWTTSVEEIKIDDKFDFFDNYSGKLNAQALSEFIDKIKMNKEDSLLLLTDGALNSKDKKHLKSCLTELSDFRFALISIGADSLLKNTFPLFKDKIYGSNEIQLVSEVLTSEEYTVIPRNIEELGFCKLEGEKKEVEDSGDDWE